jgi:glycosyltransferase involved in cell wall biosynthesis
VQIFSVQWTANERNDVIERENLVWRRHRLVGPRKIGLSPGLIRALDHCAVSCESLIHLHTLWNAVSVSSYLVASRRRVPLVVSVRGALYPWSLAQGRTRKALAWRAFVRRGLQSAAFVHVTEPGEAEAVRSLGVTTRLVTVPNGVEQVPAAELSTILRERSHRRSSGPTFLFLSRIHKKKGVDYLLHAWARSNAVRLGARLVIAGPFASGAYEREIRGLAKDLGLDSDVKFLGMLTGDDKERAFRNADVFVLPSHSENFGVAIVEALARGLPVLTTRGTPWESIVSRGAGWRVDLSVEQLASRINTIVELSAGRLTEMGERGAELAKEYGWDAQAAKLVDEYRRVLAVEHRSAAG